MTDEEKIEAYRLMMTVRRFEERCAQLYSEGDIGGFLHLYIGQEAIAAALRFAVPEDDNVITAYRDHGVAIARGLPIEKLMAEMLGKVTGVSKGKGGSMHLADVDRRYWGGYAVVGGHLPLAAGLALADQYRGDDRITVCLMGDGSTNIGYFHEALNLAGVWDLPVVWVIENNEYGMGTSVSRASANPDLSARATAYGMPGKKVDGDDVQATYDAMAEAVEHVRSGNGPILLEAMTYRFRGHSMGDPERYREKDEVSKQEEQDPIKLWGNHLINEGVVNSDRLDEIEKGAEKAVDEAVRFARESPLPSPEELYTDVYV
ncbi:MAG: pyruvate dehydrogenase (acetyl-transferring) E1 component subunit alpha [Chloroflexi bacterium]|nr:pyruvate dehydrogenase (acetyl-transferring) E1 component subunit alpha [Chloroflexota bacterium]